MYKCFFQRKSDPTWAEQSNGWGRAAAKHTKGRGGSKEKKVEAGVMKRRGKKERKRERGEEGGEEEGEGSEGEGEEERRRKRGSGDGTCSIRCNQFMLSSKPWRTGCC